MLQLGAKTKPTLAKRYITELPTMLSETEGAPWPPLVQHHTIEEGMWRTDSIPLQGTLNGVSTVAVELDDVKPIPSPTPTMLVPPLLPRAPCGDPCADVYFTKAKPKPKPTRRPKKEKQKTVDPEAYIEMVVGLLGVCIMRV